MEVWIKKNDMKRFDPSRRVPRCSWLSRFFIPKKNSNQNVNVSMCYLESDGDGFILVFFFGGERQARWWTWVFVCFCGWKLLCNKKSMNKLVMISSRLSMEAPWGRADWHWCGFQRSGFSSHSACAWDVTMWQCGISLPKRMGLDPISDLLRS